MTLRQTLLFIGLIALCGCGQKRPETLQFWHNQSQDTAVQSLILNTNLRLMPRGADITIKRELQNSDIATGGDTAAPVATAMRAGGMTFSLTGEPIWKGKKFTLEWQSKSTDNLTNSVLTRDNDTRRAFNLDIPFIGDSALQFTWSDQRNGGTRDTRQRDFTLTLTGQLTKLFDLQLSYRTQSLTDHTAPSASNHSSDLNIIIKGQKEW